MTGCAHNWKYLGSVGRPDSWNLAACESPVAFRCVFCEAVKFAKCGSGRASRCVPCASIKRGDIRAVARSGATDSVVDLVGLLTLTAPGVGDLPWDTSLCGHLDGECSGPAGCRVDADAAAAWHRSVARRWSWFMTYLRRACGDVQFFKAYEWQQRGVLHLHVLVRVPPGVSARRVQAAVRLFARQWGFGRPDLRWLPAGDAEAEIREGVKARSPRAAAAGYCAKYVSKGYDSLGDVRMLDVTTGEVDSVRLRPWSASREWGDSMATCRLRRRNFWHQGAAGSGTAPAQTGTGAPAPGGRLDPYSSSSTLHSLAGAVVPSLAGSVAM